MYQVLFNSLLYLQRYALDKRNIVKIREGSNSINTNDGVMILALCKPSIGVSALFWCIDFHLITFNTFRDMLWTTLSLEKIRKGK